MIQEAEILEDRQLSDRVSSCPYRLEGGIRCRLHLKLLFGRSHNNIVNFVHDGFIHIFIPQFMTDGLVDVLIFKVGCFYVSFGMLDASVRDNVGNLRVREGR